MTSLWLLPLVLANLFMPSKFIPIIPNSDQAQTIAVINRNFGELDAESITKVFNAANGVPSIIIGVQPDGSSAIKVAKPGFDVTTATPDQLALNSSQNNFKVVSKGRVALTHTANTTSTVVEVTHNLGYIPAAVAYLDSNQVGNSYTPLPRTIIETTGSDAGKVAGLYTFTTTATKFTVTLSAPNYASNTAIYGDTFTDYINYYLLQETAN